MRGIWRRGLEQVRLRRGAQLGPRRREQPRYRGRMRRMGRPQRGSRRALSRSWRRARRKLREPELELQLAQRDPLR